jgi:hypothetical protein
VEGRSLSKDSGKPPKYLRIVDIPAEMELLNVTAKPASSAFCDVTSCNPVDLSDVSEEHIVSIRSSALKIEA